MMIIISDDHLSSLSVIYRDLTVTLGTARLSARDYESGLLTQLALDSEKIMILMMGS